jgi:hypothetical protein
MAENDNVVVKTDDSIAWFKSRITDLQNKKVEFKKESFPKIGKMYLFTYDPKHKLTLPFYDVFPLVFPIEYYSDGFLGLNLHYLPPRARSGLLDSLTKIATDDKYNEDTKLNISYGVLKSAADSFGDFNSCIKRYLYGHVRSSFSYISPNDWVKASMLPLQKWRVNPDVKYSRLASPPY